MVLWKGSFVLLLLFVCVLVGAAYSTGDQEDQESLLEREDKTDESVQAKENVNIQKRGWFTRRSDISRRRFTRRKDISRRRYQKKCGLGSRSCVIYRRRITDEADSHDNDNELEEDNIIIDTDKNVVVDVITGGDGDEVTITDYNKGILAVLTPGDKMCRLHELAAEDRDVDLKTESEVLGEISEGQEDWDTTLDRVVEYEESNKPVKEEDLGEKIAKLCKRKSFKMVWMEAVTESHPDQGSDGEDESERMIDAVLDGTNKRGKCASGWVWACDWVCVNTSSRKCKTKRPHCSKQECG